MKTIEVNTSSTPLTEKEKIDMDLVQEARDHGVYIDLPPKEQTLRNAVEKALKNQ